MNLSLSLQEMQHKFGGQLLNNDLEFSKVTTDTRKMTQGSLFVALKGERFDGHDFINQVLANGCSGLVLNHHAKDWSQFEALQEKPVWLVNDTTKALGDIAKQHRESVHSYFFAITGSSGKTTVKGMLRSICKAAVGERQVLATQGNLNNHFGVPFTLFEVTQEHRFAVIEMGASALGEINYLSDMTRPHVAVINNVMPAHLEGFGSVDNIAKAKGEIYEGLAAEGVAVVNLDDHYAEQWLLQNSQRRVLGFSARENSQANIIARHIKKDKTNCYRFDLHMDDVSTPISLAVMGAHNVNNALAAASMAWAADINKEYIKQGLESFAAESGRLQLVHLTGGHSLIDDTYNANPGSVRAAVDVLSNIGTQKILILGDMAELGESGAEEHERIGAYSKRKNIDHLITIGAYAKNVNSGFGVGALEAKNIEHLIEKLMSLLSETSTILVKGSRSSKMENVVNHLKNQRQS